MASGKYAEAFELFTPQMKVAMPVDRLSETSKTRLTSPARMSRRRTKPAIHDVQIDWTIPFGPAVDASCVSSVIWAEAS